MPSYTRGRAKGDLQFVKVHTGQLYYGFRPKDYANITGISAADITALGWLLPTAVPATGIGILGANSPQPQRVRKTLIRRPGPNQQGSASTFCSHGSFAGAQAVGWQLVGSARGVTVTSTERTKTCGAKASADSGLYLFPLNGTDATTYATELGLILPASISAAERLTAFSGASRPRPAKVGRVIDAATGATFSSFCSYDKLDEALTAGYQIIKGEVLPPL
jgi:hypothetical protein